MNRNGLYRPIQTGLMEIKALGFPQKIEMGFTQKTELGFVCEI